MDSFLVHPLILAVMAGVAIYVQWRQGRYEYAFARTLYFWLYLFLFLYPDMPIETARFYNRYFLLLMFLVEAISYYHRTRGMRHASQ